MMQVYRASMMQAYRAARGGVGTTALPRPGGRLEALLAVAAILVVVAVMALMTQGLLSPARGGVGAQDANLEAVAGSAIVHDDAGNVPLMGAAVIHDDAGDMPVGAGSAIAHDDAGNVRPR